MSPLIIGLYPIITHTHTHTHIHTHTHAHAHNLPVAGNFPILLLLGDGHQIFSHTVLEMAYNMLNVSKETMG